MGFFFPVKYDTEFEASILFKNHAVKLYLELEISPRITLLDLYFCLTKFGCYNLILSLN